MRRLVLAGLTILLLFGVVTTAHATTAAESQSESEFLARTNADRAANGVGALRVAGDLVDIARRHSAEMAASNSIYHSSNLGSQIQNWQKIGENVGRGSNVDVVQNAFMASPTHRSNIVDSAFTETGIGVVWKDSTLYVTVLFRKPQTTSSTATAAPPAPKSSQPAAPAPATVRTASAAPRPTARPAPVAAPTPPPPAPPAIPAFSAEAVAASMNSSPWHPSTTPEEVQAVAAASHRSTRSNVASTWAVIARLLAVALVGALAALLYERRTTVTVQPA